MRYIVFLRGINLGSRNRIAMPALRDALEEDGFADVRTYLQSGNVVLSSRAKPDEAVRRVIAQGFGLDIAVVTRTHAQLAQVVERNPLARVAKNPKRYQVSFLAAKASREVVRRIEEAADPQECVVVDGREIYAASRRDRAVKAVGAPGRKDLGITATARNWTTVQNVLELAS